MICEVKETLKTHHDPITGIIWQRMFVPQREINKYIQWGEIGRQIFQDATEKYTQIILTKKQVNKIEVKVY